MGKVTIVFALLSSLVMLITFGKGIGVLRGGDVTSHFQWAMASLVVVLASNLVAMVHAAQSDRIIRELRNHLGGMSGRDPVPHE